MSRVHVAYKGDMSFEAQAGAHSVRIDLPEAKGGHDSGMTPPETFISSLGACIGVYVARYCQNAKLDARDMAIDLTWTLSPDSKAIDRIEVKIALPNAEVGRRAGALLEVARACLIHRTIETHPDIRIDLLT